MSLIFCSCGCGERFEEFLNYRKRKYIKGHHFKNKHFSTEHRKNISKSKIGKSSWNNGIHSPSPMEGKRHTKKSRDLISKTRIENGCAVGIKNPMFGIHNYGEKSGNWKGGINCLHNSIRKLDIYYEWCKWIVEWDNFTCQHCGNKNRKNLISHHIKRFSEIIEENHIHTTEQANACEFLWDISNGITYCKSCHYLLKNKGGLLL